MGSVRARSRQSPWPRGEAVNWEIEQLGKILEVYLGLPLPAKFRTLKYLLSIAEQEEKEGVKDCPEKKK